MVWAALAVRPRIRNFADLVPNPVLIFSWVPISSTQTTQPVLRGIAVERSFGGFGGLITRHIAAAWLLRPATTPVSIGGFARKNGQAFRQTLRLWPPACLRLS